MILIRTVVNRISQAMAVLAALGASVLVVAVTYDVFVRSISGGSTPGILEFSETMLVWIVFLGLPYAEQAGVHVRMSLVTDRLPVKVAQICRTVAYFLAVLVLAWMAFESGERALDSVLRGEVKQGLMQWPMWPARMVLCLGVVVLTLQCILRIEKTIKGRGMPDGTSSPGVDQSTAGV